MGTVAEVQELDVHDDPPPSARPRTPSGYRDYDTSAIERMTFIRYAQGAGVRVHEIREELDIADADGSACQHVQPVIEDRRSTVDQFIAGLTQARRLLNQLVEGGAAQDPADCHGHCKILAP